MIDIRALRLRPLIAVAAIAFVILAAVFGVRRRASADDAATANVAAEMKTRLNVAYTDPADDQRRLDVYAPAAKDDGEARPIIVWIHGGAWKAGDKRGVQLKPRAFTDRGCIFVSVNYRFRPKVTVADMAGDIAKSIRWVRDRVEKNGGSTDHIFVAGHSAGAHLAALVCTDEEYLKAEGLTLADVRGCIPVDTAAYDVPAQVKNARLLSKTLYTSVFGADEKSQRQLSPITHVAKDKHIPPFCILHVASRPDSTARSKGFAKALEEAEVQATLVPGEDKTHGTINRDLGKPNDPPTRAVFAFLKELTQDDE